MPSENLQIPEPIDRFPLAIGITGCIIPMSYGQEKGALVYVSGQHKVCDSELCTDGSSDLTNLSGMGRICVLSVGMGRQPK